MPNYLRLTDIATGKSHENRGLIEVDEKLCAALGVPCNDNNFYKGWVDWDILYMKNDWPSVRQFYEKLGPDYADKLLVIDWLANHYSLDGYYAGR